jgi:hypothetical protein
VADAPLVAADVVELRDALRPDKLAHLALVRCGLGALRRHAVIEDDGDLLRVPDARFESRPVEDLRELVDHERRVLV